MIICASHKRSIILQLTSILFADAARYTQWIMEKSPEP